MNFLLNSLFDGGMMSTVLVIGAGVVGLMLLFRLFFRRGAETRPTPPPSTDRPRVRLPEEEDGVFGGWTPALAGQIPESEQESTDFAELLRQAGMYSPGARNSIYALRFVLLFLPLVGAGILAVLARREDVIPILIGGAATAAGLSIVPRLYVFARRNARVHQIRGGLADMMDMLSMCLGGGMPLSPSLEHVAGNLEESYPALAEELRILRKQAEVGSLRRALGDFADRINLPEVRQVAGLLGRGEQLGTRVSNSLLDQADHFRATRRQLATMQANKTPVYLTLPLMFCFAPSVIVLLMSPALLELNEFLRPEQGESIMAGNDTLGTEGLVNTIRGLDNDLPAPPAEN